MDFELLSCETMLNHLYGGAVSLKVFILVVMIRDLLPQSTHFAFYFPRTPNITGEKQTPIS